MNTGDDPMPMGSGEGQNDNIWMGECDQCIRFMYQDIEFRDKWVLAKKNPPLRPPRLEIVEWRLLPLRTPKRPSDYSSDTE